MKLYLVERHKLDYCLKLVCANYQTVLTVLSELDGSDEHISVDFVNVEDTTIKSSSKK